MLPSKGGKAEDAERGPEPQRSAAARARELYKLLELGRRRRQTLDQAARLGALYELAIGDLLRARRRDPYGASTQQLEAMMRGAYATLHGGVHPHYLRAALRFLGVVFPRLVRREMRAVALAFVVLIAGALAGGVVMAVDPGALAIVVPDMHQEQTPEERVRDEAYRVFDAGDSVVFSSVLFTHNIQVTFLVFALGITCGLGTAAVLFWNGVPIGALAVQYFASGRGLFFLAWILPHGVLELTVVAVAGGAGFILARALLRPGMSTRRSALGHEARRAVQLVLGGMPMLVVAGLVEGTVSQMHPPELPYSLKLSFAALMALATFAYLALPGRALTTARR